MLTQISYSDYSSSHITTLGWFSQLVRISCNGWPCREEIFSCPPWLSRCSLESSDVSAAILDFLTLKIAGIYLAMIFRYHIWTVPLSAVSAFLTFFICQTIPTPGPPNLKYPAPLWVPVIRHTPGSFTTLGLLRLTACLWSSFLELW